MNATTIAHYRVIEKLGAGGMGDVYLAQNTKLDRYEIRSQLGAGGMGEAWMGQDI